LTSDDLLIKCDQASKQANYAKFEKLTLPFPNPQIPNESKQGYGKK
jgi:hypothetical protein